MRTSTPIGLRGGFAGSARDSLGDITATIDLGGTGAFDFMSSRPATPLSIDTLAASKAARHLGGMNESFWEFLDGAGEAMPFFNIDDLSPPAFDPGMTMHRGGLSFNAFGGFAELSEALSPGNDGASRASTASSADGCSGLKASSHWGNGIGLSTMPLIASGERLGVMSLRSDEADEEGMDVDTDLVSDIDAAASAEPLRLPNQDARAGKTLRRVQQRLNGAHGAGIGRHNPLDKTLRKKHRSANGLSSMIGSSQHSSSNKGELANRLRNAASAPQLSLSKDQDASLASLNSRATDGSDTQGSEDSNVPPAPASSPNPTAFITAGALFNRRSSTRSQKGDEPLVPLEPVHTEGQDHIAKDAAMDYTTVPVPMSAPAGISARITAAATAGAPGARSQAGTASKNYKGEKQRKQQQSASWPMSGTQQGAALYQLANLSSSSDTQVVPGLSAGDKNISPASTSGNLSTPQTPNWQSMMSLPSEALYASRLQPVANLPGPSRSGERIDVSVINDPALAALASATNARHAQSLGVAVGRASIPRRGTVSAVEGAAMRGPSMQVQSAGPTFPTYGYISQSAPVSTIPMPNTASIAAQRAADTSPTYYDAAMIQAQRDAQLQMQLQLQAQLQPNMPSFASGLGLHQPVGSTGMWQGPPAGSQSTVTVGSAPARNIAGSKRVESSPAGRKKSLPGIEPPFVTAGNRRGQWEFINYGIEDADELCAAVAPSGSYKVPLSGFVPDGDDEDDDDEEASPNRKKKNQGKRSSAGSSSSKGAKALVHKRSRSDV